MGRPAIDSSNSHLASSQGARRRGKPGTKDGSVDYIEGKGSSLVIRVGCDLEAALKESEVEPANPNNWGFIKVGPPI